MFRPARALSFALALALATGALAVAAPTAEACGPYSMSDADWASMVARHHVAAPDRPAATVVRVRVDGPRATVVLAGHLSRGRQQRVSLRNRSGAWRVVELGYPFSPSTVSSIRRTLSSSRL